MVVVVTHVHEVQFHGSSSDSCTDSVTHVHMLWL